MVPIVVETTETRPTEVDRAHAAGADVVLIKPVTPEALLREIDRLLAASKTFPTFFFPVGEEILRLVEEWVQFLRDDKHWGPDDPLFPATDTSLDGSGRHCVRGLRRQHWRTAGPIRSIFKAACQANGIPYFNPHSIRKTLVALGETRCKSPEQFKAWSQNLGHEAVMTTFHSYGAVKATRQSEILRELARAKPASATDLEVVELARQLHDRLRYTS